MVKRVVRGYSAESITITALAARMRKAAEGSVWPDAERMKVVIPDRAGTPKKTKITIIVEFE